MKIKTNLNRDSQRAGNRFTRVALGALSATALMCVLSVSSAAAQAPAPPSLPFIPADFGAPPPPAGVDSPESTPSGSVDGGDTGTGGAAGDSGTDGVDAVGGDSTSVPQVMGSKVRWSGGTRRTLSVAVSCGRSGTVTVSRNGSRIGRRTFACPASGNAQVRVRITDAAARQLRTGAGVRVEVRTGDQQHTKRMRVVRGSSVAAVGSSTTYASETVCSDWYVSNRVAWVARWVTSTTWWEGYCFNRGYLGGHLADWWHFYWSAGGNHQEYYGTWRRYHADGCWYYWHASNGGQYGPLCP